MKKILSLFTALLFAGSMMVVQAATWTAAGQKAILNGTSDWVPSNTSNDLTNVSGTWWGLLVTNKSLTTDNTYEFKICKDHGWGTAYPGSNYQLSVKTAETYNIIYSFNTSGNAVLAVPFRYFIVAGSQAVFGTDWNTGDTNNEMSSVSTYVYRLTKSNVKLYTGNTYAFKVTTDNDWDYAYPSSNKTFTVTTNGVYNVQIDFNIVTKDVTVTTTYVSPLPVTIHSNITNPLWSESAAFTVASGNATASLTIPNVAKGDYQFGIKFDGNWRANQSAITRTNHSATIAAVNTGNCTFHADIAGAYTFTWTYATNTLDVTYPDLPPAYAELGDLAAMYYVGDQVTLSATSNLSNATYAYQVKIDDGAFEDIANPYTFAEAGSHTFKVIATGDEGSVNATGTEINVYAPMTVYFVNKEGWATPYIYSFSPVFYAWPGEAMIATGETTQKHGYAVYSHIVPAGANTQVIFHNNNGTQTSDLPINPAKPYRYDNEWYATLAECDPNQGVDFTGLATEIFKGTEVTFAAAATGITNPVYTFYVKEAGGEYGSAVTAYTFDAAGAYVVKVEAEGDNTTEAVVREKEITIYEHYTFHNGDIIYVDFSAVSGDVKDVNFPFGYVVTEGDPLDYDAEGAGTRKVVVFSQDVQWSTLDNFIKTAKAGWTGLKFISPAAGQNCAVVAEDGLSYTWGTHVPTLQLNGTFESTEWAPTANFVLDASGEFATLEMPNLAEGSYDFKVVMEGNQWRGNGATFTRENNSGAMPTNGDNMKLTADVTGTYTFKWTYATNTLEITYPAPPVPGFETVRDGLTAGNYYTVCYDKTMTAIQGASLWSFAGKDANMAYIVEAEAPYLAGTPYLIYAESEALEAMTETVDDPVAGNNNGLYGTFSYLNADALAAAGATHMLKNNEIRPLGNNNHLDANRAYIILSEIGEQAPAPGRRVRAIPMQNNVVTGIDNGEWTNGEGANVQKIFIDGQIYILRSEKMYDATGRLVK